MGKAEAYVENYLRDQLKKIGGKCLKFNTMSENGWPDRICFLEDGTQFWVECKATKGRLSTIQKRRIKWLRAIK